MEEREFRLPWFWMLFGLAAAIGTRVALKRNHVDDLKGMKALVARGVNLEEAREIEYTLVVLDQQAANDAARRLREQGYVVRVETATVKLDSNGNDKEATEHQQGYLLHAAKVETLYGDTLKVARQTLGAIASSAGGRYLGWSAHDKPSSSARRGEA